MASPEHVGQQFAEYQTGHRPPEPEYGASMDNPEMMFPDYHRMPHVYRTGYKQVDQESHRVMSAARGNPEASVTVYRAMPNNGQGINPGDWVTPSRTYADVHRESNGKPDWQIAQRTVKARHLYSEGNSIAEWGWHPDGEGNF